MALNATYHGHGNTVVHNTYVRIDNIWGSKKQGWNAFVGVFKTRFDQDPISSFSVTADYEDGTNPFIILYNKVKGLAFLTDITDNLEVAGEVPAPTILTVIANQEPLPAEFVDVLYDNLTDLYQGSDDAKNDPAPKKPRGKKKADA